MLAPAILKETCMTELDIFVVSFCVAFIVASHRFKSLVALLSRPTR